jgi:hypothetical protein
MPLYIPEETVPPMYPPRKAVLYVVDEASGKTYPVKVTVLGNNTVLLPISVENPVDASNNLKINVANAGIMLPVDIQGRLKGYTTLYSGTVSASGNSGDSDLGIYGAMEVLIKVTSVSGTSPTLDVYVEGKFEVTGDYKTLASQTGINATGTWTFTVNPLIFKLVRVRWVVGGTSPSFTFSVTAQTMV